MLVSFDRTFKCPICGKEEVSGVVFGYEATPTGVIQRECWKCWMERTK
jgi:hypothetical protein